MNAPDPAMDDLVLRMQQHRRAGIGAMAAGMAHEINQPLGGIRGFAEGLQIGLEEGWEIGTDEILEKMRRIIAEVDRIDELIMSLRTFADEHADATHVPLSLPDIIDAAVRLHRTRMQARGIALRMEYHAATTTIRGNPFTLQEALQHIIDNAIAACHKRHGRRGGAIVIRCQGEPAGDGGILLEIEDTGCGMDAPTLARAGEPFFTTRDPGSGAGLGLAIVQRIVRDHCGDLSLSSTPEAGTTVRIRLPHHDEQDP